MPSIWIVLFSPLARWLASRPPSGSESAGQLMYRQLKDCSVNDKSRGQGTFRPNAARYGWHE
jgi:hypothetical protein